MSSAPLHCDGCCRCRTSEDNSLHSDRRDNLKSHLWLSCDFLCHSLNGSRGLWCNKIFCLYFFLTGWHLEVEISFCPTYLSVSGTALAYCCSDGSLEVEGRVWGGVLDGVPSGDRDFWLYLPPILWSCTRLCVLLSSAQCRAAQHVSLLLTWTKRLPLAK